MFNIYLNYFHNFNQNYHLNCCGVMVTQPSFYVCIRVIMSPWTWLEYRPKHVGRNNVYKIYHTYWSAFVGYLYILDENL